MLFESRQQPNERSSSIKPIFDLKLKRQMKETKVRVQALKKKHYSSDIKEIYQKEKV